MLHDGLLNHTGLIKLLSRVRAARNDNETRRTTLIDEIGREPLDVSDAGNLPNRDDMTR